MKLKTLFLIITLLLLSACGTPRPKKTPHVVHHQEAGCMIDSHKAPLWCCDTHEDKADIRVRNGSFEDFEKKSQTYLENFISKQEAAKFSQADRDEIIKQALLHLEDYSKTFTSDDALVSYTLYEIEKKTLESKLLASIEQYKTSRSYENCFLTGKKGVSKECLTRINSFLKKTRLRDKRKIIIEVHSDKEGSAETNLAISKKRAQRVAASLFYKEYKFSQVYYAGFGEKQLLYDAKSPKANRVNRRIIVSLRDKSYKIDKSRYQLYVKKSHKKTKQTKKKKSKIKSSPQTSAQLFNILDYTGAADTGWIYFGKPALKEKFTISCADDAPREIRRKSIDKASKSEFMSALYKETWRFYSKQHRFQITPISVFENGKLPKQDPNVIILKAMSGAKVLSSTVNTYRGKKGMLYRLFIDKKNSPKSDLKCIDLIFPYQRGETLHGMAYFEDGATIESESLFVSD